jgi:DNA-binding ferritin-like protein
MADDAKQAWTEVGERFSSWGHRVAERYREADKQERTTEEREREVERAAKEIVDELGRGVSAFADTVKDEEAKRELTEAFRSMGDAITATFEEIRDGLRSSKTPPEPPEPTAPPTS